MILRGSLKEGGMKFTTQSLLITDWVGGCKREGCSQVFLLFLGIYLQPPEESSSDSETAFNFK